MWRTGKCWNVWRYPASNRWKYQGCPGIHPNQTAYWHAAGRSPSPGGVRFGGGCIHLSSRKTQGTTGKRLVIRWSSELRDAVQLAKAVHPSNRSTYLFRTRIGACYFDEEPGRPGGWHSMWRGFMTRLLTETKIVVCFTEHNLRATCASDAKTLGHARALLAHADGRPTDRVYRRKPEMVNLLR